MPRDRDLIYFIDPAKAIDGIVALGGPLSTINLLRAYCSGIFPWPINEHVLPWCCPEERASSTLRSCTFLDGLPEPGVNQHFTSLSIARFRR